MEKKRTRAQLLGLGWWLIACAAGCGLLDRGLTPPDRSRSGIIELRLVDTPTPELEQIVVTLARVDAHVQGHGWSTLSAGSMTIDLLALQDGAFASLGAASLPVGHLTQLRLVLQEGGSSYVVERDGTAHPLQVPSGAQSGIALVGGFDVPPCASGHITVDFDGEHSVVAHAVGGRTEWFLRPVLRVQSYELSGTCEPDGGTLADGGAGDAAAGNEDGAADPDEPGSDAAVPPASGDGGSEDAAFDPCWTVVCPQGTRCEAGLCVVEDPCRTVLCPAGQSCQQGACVPDGP